MADRKARKERAEKKRNLYINGLTLFLSKVPFVVFCRIMLEPANSIAIIEEELPSSFKKEIAGGQELFRSAFYELREIVLSGNRSPAEAQDLLKRTVDKYMSEVESNAR